MNAELATRPAPEVTPFPSLVSMRAVHRELLKQQREAGNTPEVLEALDDFMRRARASGAVLDRDADRQAAQSLLDYWSTRLYRLGHDVPDAILDEFDPDLSPELDDSLDPYMGLEAFQENNTGFFFGRQRLVESLVEHLKDNRLLVLVGPSGSGKSSVVRAGLTSTLKDGALPGSEDWNYLAPIVPGSQPLVTLARLAQQAAGGAGPVQPQAAFLRNSRQLLQSLTRDTVVVVDQFEEVFTLCGDDRVRTAFVNNLTALTQAPGARHIVILTMRTDFEGQVARLPEFQALFEKALVRVTPLNAAELREAIEAPANLVGLKFEEGMVEALLNDVLGESAALPLLQFTLLKLWEARERNRVTWGAYRRLGGGRQALANTADGFYRQLIPEEQLTAKRLLLRLVRPGEGLEVTSNRVRRGSLYFKGEARDRVDRVLEKLIQARLVHLTAGETNADEQVEVAHEALVRNWPTLIAWLEEERQRIRARYRLTAAAEQWQLRGRDPSALWRGMLLEEAANYTDLNELEAEFIAAGKAVLEAAAAAERAQHERELEAARKLAAAEKERAEAEKQRAEDQAHSAARLRRFNRLLTGAGAAAVLAAILAGLFALIAVFFGFQSNQNAAKAQTASTQAIQNANVAQAASTQAVAQQATAVAARDVANAQAQLALARQLAAQSVSLSNYQLDLGLLLGLEANRITDTVETRSSLLNMLGLSWQLTARLGVHTDTVEGVAFSPKGDLLASASDDRTVVLWDSSGDHFVSRNPTDCGCPVTSVAFSPDGNLLAAGSDQQVFMFTHLGDSTPTKTTLTDYPSWVRAVAFSPDSKIVAAGGDDNTIWLWEVASGKPLGAPLQGHTNVVRSLAFSPDGKLLASSSDDGSIRLWDVPGGQAHGKPLTTKGQAVRSVAFSPDGATLASGGDDGQIHLWQVASGQAQGQPLANHSAAVRSIVFSPDGAVLASASDDTTIDLWDVAAHALIGEPLTGHNGPVDTLAFSPDGKRLASGGQDKDVILWDVIAHSELRQVVSGGGQYALGVAFKPNGGDPLMAVTGNRTVTLYNLASSPPSSQTLAGHSAYVYTPAFSPDGNWLATGSCAKSTVNSCTQGEIFLWDLTVDPPVVRHKLTGDSDWLTGLAFSADSKKLISASLDKTVRVWDVASGDQIGDPLGSYRTSLESMALSQDGHTLAVGYQGADAGEGDIDLWNMAVDPPQMLHTALKAHTSDILALAFSPDGKSLASAGGDRKIVIWDVSQPDDPKAAQTLYGHVRTIDSLAFSPDGKLLASGSDDKTVILWDVASGSLVGRPLAGQTGAVASVAFSPDDQTLATASVDGTVSLWNLSLEAWHDQACQQAGRNLTQAEWAQYFGSAPYHKTCDQWPEGN